MRKIFIKPGLSDEDKMQEAEGLAQVGVELLATALSRGPKYKPLAVSLARLWIATLDEVREISGGVSEDRVNSLVSIFIKQFEIGLQDHNQDKINRWAEVGIEVLKEAIMANDKNDLVNLMADRWSTLWDKAITVGEATERWIDQIVDGRMDEFGGYVRDGRAQAAQALAGVGVVILRASFRYGYEKVQQNLAYRIVMVLQMALESKRDDMVRQVIEHYRDSFVAASLDAYQSAQPDDQETTGHLFNTAASLILTAQEHRYHRLLSMLARGSLEVVEGVANYNPDPLRDDIHRRIQEYQDSHCGERTSTGVERIRRAVVYLLQTALMEHRKIGTFEALIKTCMVLFDGVQEGGVSKNEAAVIRLIEDYRRAIEAEE